MLALSDFAPYQISCQELLTRLVEIETPSNEKQAVDRLGKVIAEELGMRSAEVTVIQQEKFGNHVIGRWNPSDPAKGILLLCHMDTVHPVGTLARNPIHERDGKIFGPGIQDMKAGIAIVLEAIRALQENDRWVERPVTALFTSDEEVGSHSSRMLIETNAQDSELVLCLEPCLPDGSVKTWRKGVGGFEIAVRGKSAHAGAAHADGRNAIEELAHQVIRIQKWTDYASGTTLNVGKIEGGTATNVVPAWARAVVDFRVKTPEEADRILAEMESLQPVIDGTTIKISGGINRPPMPRDEMMIRTYLKAKEIAARLGISLSEGGTGGGSDANFIAPLGVPVLDGLGALGAGQHTENEYVISDSLYERAALLAGLITEW